MTHEASWTAPHSPGAPGINIAPARQADRCYLTASLTKPIVALVAVQLAADGHWALNEPVRSFVDGFHRGPLRNITLRHLLTHTSGLPDMLPHNAELRMQHAPLSEFVRHTSLITPDFQPGTACRYSSMGVAVLAAAMENILQQPIAMIIADRLFQPLGMDHTWLGLPTDRFDELSPLTVPCELPEWQSPDSDWNWNSRYWRTLGAPWGGLISTASDLGRLATMILRDGRAPDDTIVLTPATIHACCRNQTKRMAGLPADDQLRRPWGFGWRMNWPDHAAAFSDFLPSSAIGHWGATGTMMWICRRSQRWCVVLTNQPYERSQSFIQRISNCITASTSCRTPRHPNTNS